MAAALSNCYTDTQVEYLIKKEDQKDTTEKNNIHIDLYSNDSYIELKTSNTSYRCPNVENKTRPITKNINGIIEDIKKLRNIQNKVLALS